METRDLLMKLVAMDTSTLTGANAALEHVAGYLHKQGIAGKIVSSNQYKSYVAILGEGEKTLVLNGHLDVVSGKSHQFEPLLEGDRLKGRGTADMKAGVVAMIKTMISLKDKPLRCRVMLQLVTDEEIGGGNGSKFLVDEGYLGDFVICTEPTNFSIAIQAKGILRLDVVSRGRSAHGSRPWEGDNAIEKAFKNFENIQSLPLMHQGNDFYQGSSLNLAVMEGGDIYNRVPDTCTMKLDLRYVPQIDPGDLIARIEAAVDGEVRVVASEPGVLVARDHPYLKQLQTVIQGLVPDLEVKFTGQHGGSDARFFSEKGIPAIEFGPVGQDWHGEEESVSLQSVEDLYRVLEAFALDFH